MKRFLFLMAALSAAFIACSKDDSAEAGATYGLTQSRSAKRGVAFSFSQLPDQDVPLLGDAISWSYNWSSNVPGAAVDAQFRAYGLDWCPMIWNGNYNPDNIRAYKKAHPEARYILAFNEPNLMDQANMTPAQAAELWTPVVALAKELDMKLISPALNYGTLAGYNDPVVWMDEFLAQPGVSLDDIDGIALHCYMPSAGSVKGFIDRFDKYRKPVWLTEFCNGNTSTIAEQTQLNYMCETLNMLETDNRVFRYAWFIPRGSSFSGWHNALLSTTTPVTLTTLGQVFVHFSTFDPSVFYGVGDVVPAEQYVSASGLVHLAPSTDGGILDISELGMGGEVAYQLDIAAAGTYTLEYRYQTYMDSSLTVQAGTAAPVALSLPDTGKVWQTGAVGLSLPAGRSTLTLTGASGATVMLNWLRIK